MLAHVLREYNINRILLSRLGLWPFQSKLARSLLPIFCLLLEMSYYPFEILMFYDHRDDAQMIFESCYQLVITTAFLVRLWNEIWNRDKFQHLYEAMNAHWDVFTDDSEIRILKEYSTVSRKFTIFYATMMYILMSMFVVIPLIPVFLDIVLPLNESRPRILAIDVEFRVDTSEYFTPIFCYTTAIIVVGVSIMVGVDTMHFTCTTHACGLFFIVGEKIENILKAADESKCCGCCRQRNVNATELGLSNERAIYDRYVDCLRKYQHALEFVNILNSTHQTVAVFFLLLIGATLSLIGVRIVYELNQMKEMFRFTCIVMGALLQLMVMCYSGQKLMDESQNVFHRTYAAEWYTFSPRLKSLMIVTLYRSVVPCSLTAGKMLPLSMTTYAGVVRTGVSYFTAFLSLKD
ncbi:odorant receptor 63a-like [Harpegnathos saltator]|uniref:odorant receptor 63a-like n=1 Tax=Harpegnathos saltator TaxID=610380 RepID=UPI000DBED17B|nr:odorant receptor 63a-like [Harpegnathos saltator]